MKKNICVVVLLFCMVCSMSHAKTGPVTYTGRTIAEVEEALGKPKSVREEKGQQILEYVIDKGGVIGRQQLTLTVKNGKVISERKAVVR